MDKVGLCSSINHAAWPSTTSRTPPEQRPRFKSSSIANRSRHMRRVETRAAWARPSKERPTKSVWSTASE
eukprot:2350898-Pyramimonas_sp.AAC.1